MACPWRPQDYLMIKKITPGIAAWNESNPASHQIGVFDRILEVNGQGGPGKDLAAQQQGGAARVGQLGELQIAD
eukprot:Skav232997  [mRNA]  locus=scaffold387:224020:224696:+ [translate_table: standard]